MISEITVFETTIQILSRGGWVLIPIFLLGWFAWFLLIERYFFYKSLKGRIIQKKEMNALENGDLDFLLRSLKESYLLKLLQVIKQYQPNGKMAVRHAMEAVQHDVQLSLSKSLKTISMCASLAPMLGLLGTVSGMVHTFEVIQLFGFGNPVLLAEGISEALLTTQAGLLVAFPLMLALNYLSERINHLETKSWSQILVFENSLWGQEDM